MRGETKSRVAMSLLPSPSLTSRTTSRSVGVSAPQPLAGRLAFAAAALRVGDRVLGGQRVGDEQVRLNFGGTRERVVGVALGLLWLPLRDPQTDSYFVMSAVSQYATTSSETKF